MKILDFTFIDTTRSRQVPACVYLPENAANDLPVVIFNPGYREQDERTRKDIPPAYKNYHYLAEYFTHRGYAFISLQHDLIDDTDGLEVIDPTLPQHEAREYLYKRGVENILYALTELTRHFPHYQWQRYIIAGHSNGGDIAKYFANSYSERISCVIAMDARRCRIEATKDLRILMFEANDTSTDFGVIPGESTADNPKRDHLEWVIIKPKNALHKDYNDSYISADLKKTVQRSIDWFLNYDRINDTN